jgi:hypothetical protein
MRTRGLSSRVAGMIRVTRDRAELKNVPFIRFWVWLEPPNSSNEKASVCGVYSGGSSQHPSLPVAWAFEKAWGFAVEKGISAILIDDPRRLFEFEPWVRNRLIDYLDDRS